jgi:hypothetical protein
VLIAVGTLMLAGDDDPITPLANARLMTYLIPNARLHVIKVGGYPSVLTRAAQVAPVILAFSTHSRSLKPWLTSSGCPRCNVPESRQSFPCSLAVHAHG